MDLERVRRVIEFYDAVLEENYHVGSNRFVPPRYPEGAPPAPAALRHLRYMITEMRGFIVQGRTEKAMRWLGFLQGVLWALGVFSIDELKDHSRPDYGPPVFGQRQCRDLQNCGVEGYQCGCREAHADPA